MTAIDTARAVLAVASLADQTMPKPDENVLKMWAEILGDIDHAAAKRAIIAHYQEEHRRIMPSDIRRRVDAEAVVQRAQAAEARRQRELDNPNLVPDADPDDVTAWLAAKREGRLVDNSPRPGSAVRPVEVLVQQALRGRHPSTETRSA